MTGAVPAIVVGVDGPSGSGKSSVCRAAAARFGFAYLDTGAMYRAARWWTARQGVDVQDADAVATSLREAEFELTTDPAAPRIRVRGRGLDEDVTDAIRDPRISATVSQIATNLAVRADLVARQQAIVGQSVQAGQGIVVEGRDITTVVAPDAAVRVLLTASEQARVARRAAQDEAGGAAQSQDDTRDQVLRRDQDDSTVAQFTTATDGVITLDSSELTFDQTVDALTDLIRAEATR